MDSKFVKEFKLVQDTPMWVFNPDDPGCGLRATEVKPKLDRYLREKCGVTKAAHSNWFIGDTDALDYKMSVVYEAKQTIESEEKKFNKDGRPVWKRDSNRQLLLDSEGRKIQDTKSLYPIFFGNMDANEGTEDAKAKKDLIMFSGIQLTIYCRHQHLLECVEKHLPSFFACHSFGTRQSKGFGCFSMKGTREALNNACYKFTVRCDERKDNETRKNSFESLFSDIEKFHKMIRSGIFNAKPLMYFYERKKIGQNTGKAPIWDKAIIKHHMMRENPVYLAIVGKNKNRERECFDLLERQGEPVYRKYGIYRDALGLASMQEWSDYDDSLTIEGECGGVPVKRFKSPVLYRPMKSGREFVVYVYLFDIPDEYRNATFTIKSKKGRKTWSGIKLAKEFNLKEYFKFIYEQSQMTDDPRCQIKKYRNIFSTLMKLQ